MVSSDPAKWRFESIPEDEDGSRLDRFLRRLIPGLGQGQIEKMLRNGLIRIDGAKAKSASRVATGQSIRLPLSIDALVSAKPDAKSTAKPLAAPTIGGAPLQKTFDDMVIGEGKGWIALNKPSGLAVQGGTGTKQHIDGMLAALAARGGERMRLVHRIDKDTSGVLLLAKNLGSARSLTDAFHKHVIEKTYLALCMGLPPEDGAIKQAISKLPGKTGERMVADDDGQSAHTLFRRIDHAGRKLTLMALRPLTGRTHQLRIHMALIGHVICGDGKYGGVDAHPGGMVARQLHLHAWQLKLPDGKLVSAPPSPHMVVSLDALGLSMPPKGWRFQDFK